MRRRLILAIAVAVAAGSLAGCASKPVNDYNPGLGTGRTPPPDVIKQMQHGQTAPPAKGN